MIRAIPPLPAGLEGMIAELTAMLEALQLGGTRRPPLALVENAGAFDCYRTDRGAPVRLGRCVAGNVAAMQLPRDLRAQPAEIRLDASRVISKTLQLPAASRHYLNEVVSHQLERMTPWAADRVVFDYAVAEEPTSGRDQISVRLVATSRDVFDRTLSQLAAAGIEPAVVGTSEDRLDQPSPVNLFRAGKTSRREELRRRVVLALAGIALVGLVLSALTGWRLYALNAEATQLQEDMSAARNQIGTVVSGLQLSESRGRIVAEKNATIPVVALLDRLSALIPTNTYLTELAAEGAELRLAGLSSDAPALIGILEATDLLSDVRFAAPTIRDEAAAQDRFEIEARIVSPRDAGL